MPHVLTLNSCVAAVPELLASHLAGDMVLLNLADGVYYGLDPVGARIWSLIASPKSVREIIDDVVAYYDTDKRECERDILAFLADLVTHRLVVIIAPGV